MGKLRFLLALWAAKLSIPVLKLTRHNGTDFPGHLAIKLCPDFLRYVGKPPLIIAVTGTNGKTTVSNMLSDALESMGRRVMTNRAGSNIISGISTAFIRNGDLLGRVRRCDVAVLEVDERSSPRIYPHVKPDFVLLTNLFRDSIMRNAHPYYIADILTKYIPASSRMILNADDLISCSVSPDNERVYFGIDRMDGDGTECINLIDDVRICPHCGGKLTYLYRRYHHIGKAKCLNCGFSSPESDYFARRVDPSSLTMTIREDGVYYPYSLHTDSVFDAYNTVSVVATLRQLGYSHREIRSALRQITVSASRHSEEKIANNMRLIRQMSKDKNALAGSRAFDYVAGRKGRKELLLMMNCLGDTRHWSENTCWIYDADFEFLHNDSIVQIVCAGARCLDYKLRLLMAGVPEERIFCEDDEFRAAELLQYTPGDDVYILYGTDTMARAYRVCDHIKELAQQRAGTEEAEA